MTVLGVLVTATAMPAGLANVIATAVGTVPSFELNRRWVWRKTGKRSLRGEVGPFWVLSFRGAGALHADGEPGRRLGRAHGRQGQNAHCRHRGGERRRLRLALDRAVPDPRPHPLPVDRCTHVRCHL